MRICPIILASAGFLVLSPAWSQDQPVGERFEVTPEDLPEPFATESVSNPPRVIDRPADATLAVPEGFSVTLFAEGLSGPREFEVLPNGDVLVSEPDAGRITLLRDKDGDGAAEVQEVFAEGFSQPYGIEFSEYGVYVADVRGVWRLVHTLGDLQAAGPAEPVTRQGVLGGAEGHSTRSLAFHPDGGRFYVGVGSRDNLAEEEPPRATIQEFVLTDGLAMTPEAQSTYASGLRNPVGMAFHPATRELYAVVNERDGLGDGLVPDYLTRIEEGAFYGWPYSYIGSNPQPDFAEKAPELVERAVVPDLLFEAHSAPIGLAFYDGEMFPESYRGDAFVALRGSWNSSEPTGYKVVHVPFEDGAPAGWYETFASGFWTAGEDQAEVWGRPTGVAVTADGALLIADDTSGTIWRIAYGE